MAFDNLPQMFFERAAVLGRRPRYRYRVGDEWREVTWEAMADHVRSIAAALIEMGVAPGERVAILSATRPEWVEIDLAILACGALTIPIYQSNLPAECGYILLNSEASLVFVENAKQRGKIEHLTGEGFELDGVRQTVPLRGVIQIEGDPGSAQPLADLMERGGQARTRLEGEIDRRLAALGRDALATIVYTSGTTGPPKGVPQTHGNHLATVEATLDLGIAREGDVDFFFLPLAHSFARLIEYYGIAAGTVPLLVQLQNTLAHRFVFRRIHDVVGGNIRYMTSGAAPLAREILEFFHAIGILILEGYGLTETTPSL